MRICLKCRWMKHDFITKEPLCSRPGVGADNHVTGGQLYPSCKDERLGINLGPFTLFRTIGCGEKGKYFEPKEVTK